MSFSVRDQVFETNSSSSHSVALGPGDILDKNFDQESLRAGVINLKVEQHKFFSDERYRYYQPENLVIFLLARLVGGGPDTHQFSVDQTKPWDALHVMRQQSNGVAQLIDAIEDETKCKLTMMIEPGSSVYLSYDDEAHFAFDFHNRDALRALLFNSKSYIETRPRDEDYNDGPEYIETDMGEELTAYPGEGRQLGLRI